MGGLTYRRSRSTLCAAALKRGAVFSTTSASVRTVRVKRSSYQPGKAEMEEKVQIPTTPERLAKALGRQVNIAPED